MFKDGLKFLGVCILLSSIIISSTLIYNNKNSRGSNRYYINVDNDGYTRVIDSYTGVVYNREAIVDYVNRTRTSKEIK